MKILLEFNHEKKDFFSAINSDMNGEQANEEINKLARKYKNSKEIEKYSQIAEMIHKELTYDVILFIAAHSFKQKVEESIVNRIFKQFLESEEDE